MHKKEYKVTWTDDRVGLTKTEWVDNYHPYLTLKELNKEIRKKWLFNKRSLNEPKTNQS